MQAQQCPKGIRHLRELIHTHKVTLQLYFSSWATLMAIIVHLLTSYKDCKSLLSYKSLLGHLYENQNQTHELWKTQFLYFAVNIGFIYLYLKDSRIIQNCLKLETQLQNRNIPNIWSGVQRMLRFQKPRWKFKETKNIFFKQPFSGQLLLCQSSCYTPPQGGSYMELYLCSYDLILIAQMELSQ